MKNLLKTAIMALAVFLCLSSYGTYVCSDRDAIEEAIERYGLEGRVVMKSCPTRIGGCNLIQRLFGCSVVDCDEDLRPDGIRIWYHVFDNRMLEEDRMDWLYDENVINQTNINITGQVEGFVIEYFDGDGVRQLKFIKFDC